MKTATVRDLRNHFPKIADWISQGESVQITRSGKPFARLSPAVPEPPARFKMPDFKARLDEAFGDTCYDSNEIQEGILASRGDLS